MYRDQFGEFACGYWGLKGEWLLQLDRENSEDAGIRVLSDFFIFK